MKKIISSQRVPLKGYTVQSFKSSSTKVRGGGKTIKKLTMPVSFKKGNTNPIRLRTEPTLKQMLAKRTKRTKKS